jgi:beta-xylosidase
MKLYFLTILFFIYGSLIAAHSVFLARNSEIKPGEIKNDVSELRLHGNSGVKPGLRSDCSTRFGADGQIYAGVNIHFVTGHKKDLDMIAAAGFKLIRMDFVWENIEKSEGIYDWTDYDELIENLKRRGLRPIFILDYSNPLYEDTVEFFHQDSGVPGQGISAPEHDDSRTAFVKWSTAAAEHFQGFDVIWEIWNEPNVSHFWKPGPDVQKYNALALATAKAIKQKVPGATLIGPATSKIPLSFLESFLSSGIIEFLDGVSVHPYRDYSKAPETASEDYRKLRVLIGRYATIGKENLPIISSEWGYASATKGISLAKQAEYIVRMQLSNLLDGIPLSIWYDWKNDGENPDNFEHNCGTVDFHLNPKPAYFAIRTLNQQLEGYKLSRRIRLENENDFLLLFQDESGNSRISAWTTDKPHKVLLKELSFYGENITALDGYGNPIHAIFESNKLKLDLNGLPQYLDIPGEIRD